MSKLGNALFKLERPISKTNHHNKTNGSRSSKSRGGDPGSHLPGAHKPTREACLDGKRQITIHCCGRRERQGVLEWQDQVQVRGLSPAAQVGDARREELGSRQSQHVPGAGEYWGLGRQAQERRGWLRLGASFPTRGQTCEAQN